jgi:hypothetical protein
MRYLVYHVMLRHVVPCHVIGEIDVSAPARHDTKSEILLLNPLPIECLAHDSGRTLVCAEYGYPKGSPNTNS